jgi:hypothetical protein
MDGVGQERKNIIFLYNINSFSFLDRVKGIFGTCGLKTLFFGTLVSFRFTDDTWVLEKD